MNMNELLIEAHKHLDAATVEDGIGNEAMGMYHLGYLHGLLINLIGTEKQKDPDAEEPKKK